MKIYQGKSKVSKRSYKSIYYSSIIFRSTYFRFDFLCFHSVFVNDREKSSQACYFTISNQKEKKENPREKKRRK